MIRGSKEADFTTKVEGSSNDGQISIDKASFTSSTSASSSSRLKDPRIVRVSRAFGGKDRHSKVCTVRGLRDRRVRLSVPTAIQLYDLQDRLGLNQPSKVVDWLLNAAKHEIDELPPLPVPPGCFGLNQQAVLSSSRGAAASQSDREGLKITSSVNWSDPLEPSRPNFWNEYSFNLRNRSKEVAGETANDKENWTKRSEDEEKQGDPDQGHGSYVNYPSNNFFSRPNHSSLPGLLNNAMPYNHFLWDASNLSLSYPRSHGLTPQAEDVHNFNAVPLASTLSMPPRSQVFLCPPGSTQPYNFPSSQSTTTSSQEFDPKHINFQMLCSVSQNPSSNSLAPPLYSISQPMRSFPLISMTTDPNHFPSQNNSTEYHHLSNKDNDFSSQ